MHQPTGRSKTTIYESYGSAITAYLLNRHYGEISTEYKCYVPDSTIQMHGEHSACSTCHCFPRLSPSNGFFREWPNVRCQPCYGWNYEGGFNISSTIGFKTTRHGWLSSNFHHPCSVPNYGTNRFFEITSICCCNVRHTGSSLTISSLFGRPAGAALIKLIHECDIASNSRMELSDCLNNWLVDFFQAHTYCSWFGGVESRFITILACVIT